MKTQIFIVIFCLSSLFSKAQTPFTTLVKEPRFVTNGKNQTFLAVENEEKIKNFVNDSITNSEIKPTKKNDIDFFKNNGISLNIINKGDNRYSASSQVIHYKLYVANPTEENKYRINRYNIPLMLISKLSTSYDSISASSAIDVLDYEGSPITLRIMPSFRKAFKTYNDVFYFGLYTDLRGINIHSPSNNSYKMDFIGTGGIGITYQGDGAAGTFNSNGEYEEGRYSISAIFQVATGKKEIINKLFNTDKDYVTSFQSYFLFRINEKSKLNMKIGYQYFFQPTLNGTKSNFSLSIGI